MFIIWLLRVRFKILYIILNGLSSTPHNCFMKSGSWLLVHQDRYHSTTDNRFHRLTMRMFEHSPFRITRNSTNGRFQFIGNACTGKSIPRPMMRSRTAANSLEQMLHTIKMTNKLVYYIRASKVNVSKSKPRPIFWALSSVSYFLLTLIINLFQYFIALIASWTRLFEN